VILGRFLTDPDMIDKGARMLIFQLLGMPLMGICLIVICTFQATGKAIGAFILSSCRQGVVFLPALIILSVTAGLNGVIAAQVTADIITTVVAFWLFRVFLWREIV
jgi:Na+-driven multidrug efflux pump